jgi:putative ABC transport system ATP-binding protein
VNASTDRPVVELRAVTKIYATGEVEVRALAGVDITIARGEFVAIMGASGSGKSTLMNMLGCLDRPTGGEYLLDGVPVAGLGRSELAKLRNHKIGFVFQGFNLLSRTTALENVELPMLYGEQLDTPRERHRRAAQALDRVGLSARKDHTPSQLSGGQQQRVAIARALVNNPEILLADEPTGNLDSTTSVEIMALFQELNRSGITVIMITHEADVAQHAKRIIAMRDGRIRSDAPNHQVVLAAAGNTAGAGAGISGGTDASAAPAAGGT